MAELITYSLMSDIELSYSMKINSSLQVVAGACETVKPDKIGYLECEVFI